MTLTQLLRSPAATPAAKRPRTASLRRGAGALVMGSDYRGLAVVRSLGRRGIPVWVVTSDDDVLAAHSRYATGRVASVGDSEFERCAFVSRLAEEHDLEGWTLFPTTDDDAALVGRFHTPLAERFVLTTPPWEILRWAYDKRLTYELAEEIGLGYPRTWTAATAKEAASLALDYPVIVKPAVKEGFNRLTAAKAWRVDDADELYDRFEEAAELVDPKLLLIQEIVPGGGDEQFSYAALCDAGRPLARVVARRTRQYPADFGRASTYVETIEQPEVVAQAEHFLARLGFTGLVEVEFKRDPRDGELKLLDVNPRVWGWHSLCQRAGVDFPYLAWRHARNEPVPETVAATGVRWLRLSTDLPVSLKEIAGGRLSARAYARSLRGPRESAIFARDDPVPGLLEVPMLAGVLARRLLRGNGV
ncbi:MAG TPA: ATP-grasp domain-containing protein [Gaiellaceae bacterium]|nr:ATP-grasp domain-containing protein [Gaiellaceae bacterium]